jgi:hypothetical protein
MTKKNVLAIVTVVSVLSLANVAAWAAPMGNVMAGRKYFVAAKDLSPWTAGVYFRGMSRDGEVDNTAQTIEGSKLCLYTGYDVLPWMTPYVKLGTGSISLDGSGNKDYNPEFGFGLRLNLLHHEIMDPTLFEDVIMINASCEYSVTEATRDEDTQAFAELYAAATVSILNEILGDKFYLPNGISLFLGPTYSIIESSATTTDDDFGFLFGVDIFHSERVSYYFSAEIIGSNSSAVMAGLNVCL